MTINTQTPCSTFSPANYSPGLQIFHTIRNTLYFQSDLDNSRGYCSQLSMSTSNRLTMISITRERAPAIHEGSGPKLGQMFQPEGPGCVNTHCKKLAKLQGFSKYITSI